MSLCRVFSPVLHFEDSKGHPLAGGWLYTFIAGTNTPVATFKDAAGTRNQTRVQLDARGECEIWLDPSIRYKFALYDANRTEPPIWVKDNITAPGVSVMPDTKEVLVTGSTPVVVTATTNNGITTFNIALTTEFTQAVAQNTQNIANEVTRAQNAESVLSTAIGNEVTRAQNAESALSNAIDTEENRAKAAEASAKTEVKAGENIEVHESTASDGHMVYTIDGVESVPNVNITSPNGTLNIQSSTNPQTNTKTFEMDVKGSLEYYIGGCAWKTLTNSRDIVQDLTKSKGTLNLSAPGIGKYLVSVNLRFKSNSAPENIVGELWVSLGPENAFTQMKLVDYSQNSVEDCMTVVAIKEISIASEPLTIILSLNNAPQAGLMFMVSNVSVYRISAVIGAVEGMESVEHDDTLTGDGTSASPLSVVVDDELDEESENPVQNAAVTWEFGSLYDNLETAFGEVWDAIYGVEDDLSEL